MPDNRLRRARERAGLSVGQAARLMGLDRDELLEIEEELPLPASVAERFVEIYGTRVEWLTGEVALHDYARVDKIKGAGKLSFHDRDIVAEFAASIPRTKPLTLAEVAARKKGS